MDYAGRVDGGWGGGEGSRGEVLNKVEYWAIIVLTPIICSTAVGWGRGDKYRCRNRYRFIYMQIQVRIQIQLQRHKQGTIRYTFGNRHEPRRNVGTDPDTQQIQPHFLIQPHCQRPK